MKRLNLLVAGIFAVSALTACGSQTSMDPSLLALDTQVSAQAAKQITLNMVKKNSTEIKKSTLKIKEKNSTKLVKKDAEKAVVKFTAPTGKNDFDSQNLAMIARFSLSSMNAASTYSDGYNIGIQALSQMASQGAYVARVSWASGNATKDWTNGYKVVSASLNHIANERPNTPAEICNLVITMMNQTGDYSDGYRVGLAALQVMGQTDNYTVKSIIDLAIRQAESMSQWQDGYNVIQNALAQLRNSF
mgnify:CR=1 FL=1